MSTPTNNQPAFSAAAYRQEDDRRRDEARILALQDQIDELRQTLRELLGRQGREEEQLKHYEGSAAQNRMAIDQFKQEIAQALQARALDETRTRQQLTDLEMRIDDVGRPVRGLQAHVAELIEAVRAKAEDTSQYKRRDDELQVQIDHVSASIDRTGVVSHQLRDSIDALRGEIDAIRRDIIRAEDSVKIVDQEARRRVTGAAQENTNLASRIDELRSDIGHLFDLIDDTRRSLVHIDPALEELRGANATLKQDVGRFQAQAVERHEVMLDRVEDTRQEIDARFADARLAQEQRFERLIERVEDLAEAHRDVGFRITTVGNQLDELRLVDHAIRREAWVREEQRVRLRLEQAQQELDTLGLQRRESGGEDGKAESPRQPRRQTDH
jgi:chromosome segregation ATPase